ncbi:hypothetical protein [Canibacter zhoujuaniae]|uniref:hypothetical protein n=1 Tax=Canibacter zhoujuaniae TaxID=2708343 RepID=UPI001FB924D2|nr:hypothetical protein [Canibacter zhoujuaniae]
MKGKLALFVGFGAGYVLGSRAGRKRYEQIKSTASKVWDTKLVQNGVSQAKSFAADRSDDVRQFIGTKVGEAIAGTRKKVKKAQKGKRRFKEMSAAEPTPAV